MSSTQHQPIDSRTATATIYVVDGDQSILDGVRSLLETLGVEVRCFRSAEQFLDTVSFGTPGCVVTELHLPGISGLELQKNLRQRGVDYPVIVMTSDADVSMAVRAMHLGALDFIEKPFIDRILIARVKQALRTVASLSPHSKEH
ncbi:response regulator [Gemmatimonadota bacterium]